MSYRTQNSYYTYSSNVVVFEGGIFGMWLHYKGGSLTNGMTIFIKKTKNREILHPSCHVKTEKIAIYDPGIKLLPDTEFVSTLVLDFPAFRIAKNKFVIYKLTK